MQQVIRVISGKSICILVEVFFILSFSFLSYKYNLYIVWGIIPFLFLTKKAIYKNAAFWVVVLTMLSFIYYYYSGFGSTFRTIKTMVVLLPFFFTNVLQREQYCLSKYFYFFMQLNAILVCVDFFLYNIVGRTIMNFTESGFLPRPCGLLEDSNFFSYLMLIYIYYYKWNYGHYNKLFITSLFLSGSFSAIISFLILLSIFKKKFVEEVCRLRFKLIIVLIALVLIAVYDWLAIHSDVLLMYISDFQMSDLLKVKIASISHRFTTVSNAMSELDSMNEFLFGIGAGKTKGLSDIGLNLHNSLLQMFLEMGGVLVCVVLLVIFMMIRNLRITKYVILFCVILVLGSMMETLYNPLLALVYFMSFSNIYKWNLKNMI